MPAVLLYGFSSLVSTGFAACFSFFMRAADLSAFLSLCGVAAENGKNVIYWETYLKEWKNGVIMMLAMR